MLQGAQREGLRALLLLLMLLLRRVGTVSAAHEPQGKDSRDARHASLGLVLVTPAAAMAGEAESEVGGVWVNVEASVVPLSVKMDGALPACSSAEASTTPFGLEIGDRVYDNGAGAAADVVGVLADKPFLLLNYGVDPSNDLGYATRTLTEATLGLNSGAY